MGRKNYLVSEKKKKGKENKGNDEGIFFLIKKSIEKLLLNL